jgi:RNA polymerase sigma-70 factor (ECF subfamily)
MEAESEAPKRDRDAFSAITDANRALLHRVALRLSGNPETAKDLVQDTLYRAWRRFGHFQEGTHVSTWLVTILTNAFYDQLRHEKVAQKAKPALMVHEEAECDPVISRTDDAELHAAIQALEPELRQVVELVYLEEKRYRDVAKALNIPIGTIGTRLMRARQRLHKLLTAANADEVKP